MTYEDLVPFREQLAAYPAIKKMLQTKPPRLNVAPISPPWRVYARRTEQSGWARKDFPTYVAAYNFVKVKLPLWHDVSITSKRQRFDPPSRIVRVTRGGRPVMVNTPNGPQQKTKVVPIKPPPLHTWCLYCRRFTIFTWFVTHHAHRGEAALLMDPSARRCCVCGIQEQSGAYR